MGDKARNYILGGFIGLIVLIALGFLLSGLGLLWDRPAAKYAEETRHQTYDNSREYQQGTQLDLLRYCRQYAEAPPASKKAVADLIRDTAATYGGPLTPANQACISEIGQ